MSSDLTRWVAERLDGDEQLTYDAKLLVLAALEGEDSLADLAGFAPPEPAAVPTSHAEPAGAFIKQIKVSGFRGIGGASQLDLDPFPSLTVISGRNGSGKSSFAEALEVALTGTTYRWRARSRQWKEQWRNIHVGHPARIDVTLAEEGIGRTTVTAEWTADAELDDMTLSLQRQGEKKQAGTGSLGWSGPLETYRPLLTYEELGALLAAEPKVLYDSISTVLGLGQLTDAVKALDDHRKVLTGPETALRADKKAILDALDQLDDDRATAAQAVLKQRTLLTGLLRDLATGTTIETGIGVRLRSLLGLTVPSEETCRAAADRLRAAVAGLAEAGAQVAATLQRRSRLIESAIELHSYDGDQPCPVCADGTLDAARVGALQTELESNQHELADLQTAQGRHAEAARDARSLVSAVPAALAEGPELPDILQPLIQNTRTGWDHWVAAPEDQLQLAEHLVASSEAVRGPLADLQRAAAEYLRKLDEAWSRVASQLAAHADAVDEWNANAAAAADAKAAHQWLKTNEIVLKNERVKPITDEARKIWAGLRQESNVEIAGLTLESSNTRRHVVISAEVDGQNAGALAVMSQGELHSLALALFLPRATMPDSPFRFVVLDDPVQAMDPAKVDGLVQVLLEIARTRQVIVFSHDDRFASAVRRTPRDVPVKVLNVVREANSKVTPIVSISPANRYLKDAFGLLKDDGLPEETLRRVLPGLLRMALEARARDIYFGRRLSEGAPREEVEREWGEARRTRERVALALDDPSTIDNWLGKHPYRKWAVRKANSVHDMLRNGTPRDACEDVEKAMADLERGVK